MISANNGWVLVLDNMSTVKPDLSDALCRLSTGGGFSTRTLYTDEDETIFDAQRPVILTSIKEVGTRSDLLERSLIVELPTIPEKNRRAEKTFWREFDKVRPQILGALLDVVSGAIRHLPEIERKPDAELPRWQTSTCGAKPRKSHWGWWRRRCGNRGPPVGKARYVDQELKSQPGWPVRHRILQARS